jgi:Lrp/AsnC ligand binding domain
LTGCGRLVPSPDSPPRSTRPRWAGPRKPTSSCSAGAVSKHPEVTEACTITGDADALLHIRAADVHHFEQVVERISAEPFVVRTRSVIVLSRLLNRPDAVPPGAQA